MTGFYGAVDNRVGSDKIESQVNTPEVDVPLSAYKARSSDPFRSALHLLEDVLEPEGIPLAIAGMVAANVYRDHIQTTLNIDVLVSLERAQTGVLQEGFLIRGRGSAMVY